ncbi:MAG: 2-hydroxyacyl-CoA dehydratase family protein [Lachnospiraceae bacterium]|nr:2-hydroxyacyl-CoA dehydratase family protein [Lachnospiraceae bacterium]
MNIARTYGNIVRKKLESDPVKAGKLIRKGLHLEGFRVKHLSDKRIPAGYKYLNYKGITVVADALDDPEHCAWTNIFAPVEILQNFGLTSVSMEALASYLSGFYLEDYFIDRSESCGIASTLCSYHKNFIGAAEAGVLPVPAAAVTTTLACDANVQSFRYINDIFNIPTYMIDIPHEYSEESLSYVSGQLRELICMLEDITRRKFSEERLREAVARENETKKYFLSFLDKRQRHEYPNTLTLVLFQLFATHLSIGEEWPLEAFRMMDEEIEAYPESGQKRLFWIHLLPYAQMALREYLNFGGDINVTCGDFDLDYIEEMDADHPVDAIARKMILNIYNGGFERKADAIADMIRKYDPDGVVEFCHWGCSQSSGGVMLMKEKVRETGKPMLILDGDAVDRRNSPDGQIKTRFEAFLELLGKGGETA